MRSIRKVFLEQVQEPKDWPWKNQYTHKTYEETKRILQNAVKNGKKLTEPASGYGGDRQWADGPAPKKGDLHIWEIGNEFIGAFCPPDDNEERYLNIYSVPKYGMKSGASLDDYMNSRDPEASAEKDFERWGEKGSFKVNMKLDDEEIDPWSDESDDYGTSLHWMDSETFKQITNIDTLDRGN